MNQHILNELMYSLRRIDGFPASASEAIKQIGKFIVYNVGCQTFLRSKLNVNEYVCMCIPYNFEMKPGPWNVKLNVVRFLFVFLAGLSNYFKQDK